MFLELEGNAVRLASQSGQQKHLPLTTMGREIAGPCARADQIRCGLRELSPIGEACPFHVGATEQSRK